MDVARRDARRRLVAPDALLALALLAGALLARWPLVGAPPYGDEAVHFVMARSLGFLPSGIVWAGSGEPFDLLPLVVGRPLFALAHMPGALAGFDGFRLLGTLYASLLAPVAFGLLRRLGVARWLSVCTAAVVVLHPTFVVWGTRIFPDSLMAVLVLLAIGAWVADRPVLGSVLIVLACWTKESALAAAVGLAAFALWTAFVGARAEGRSGVRALLTDRRPRWAGAAVLAALLPLAAAYVLFPRLPGWTLGGEFAPAWERLWLTSWFAIGPLVALLVRKARPLAAAGLGLVAFYLAFHGLRGGFLQSWFAVLPGVVGLLCCAVALDAAFRSVAWPRLAAAPVTVLAASLLVAAVVGTAGPVVAFHPLAPMREPGLAESRDFVRAEGAEVAAARAFHEAARPGAVLLLDVQWFWIGFPFAGGDSTQVAYPLLAAPPDVPVEELARQAEASDLVWMQDWDLSFGRAFRTTYADCEAFAAGNWVAFRVDACPGRAATLRTAFELDVVD